MNKHKTLFYCYIVTLLTGLLLIAVPNAMAQEENVGRYALIEQATGKVVNVILLDPIHSSWAPPAGHFVIPAGNASPGEDIWDGQKFKKGAQKKPELSPVPVSADGSDIAEFMPAADPSIEPGDLVAVSKQGFGIRKSNKPYDKDIIGIVSTDPGVILGKPQLANQQKVALAGVVPLKVSLENGPIAVGDRITSSSLLGVGMAACAKAPGSQGKLCKDGQTIGIALTPYDGTQSTSKILVFVNLGYQKLNLNTEIASSGSLNFLNSSSQTSFSLKLDEPKGLFTITSGSSSTPRFTMDLSGNVGIGTTLPTFRLDIADMQAATAVAQIFNTDTGTASAGLVIKLGSTSTTEVASTNHFINFETAGIGIVGSISGNGAKGVTYATSGVADFAEYFKKDPNQNVEFGSVMCVNESGFAVLCNSLNSKILGIASERPAFLGGENLGDGSVAVGLVGQVYARVSAINGSIKPGDPLTSSSAPGVAVKAKSAGQIVGKALESFGFENTTNTTNTTNSQIGKILVSVNVSWYDPTIYIALDGTLGGVPVDTTAIDPLALQGDALQDQTASASAQVSSQLSEDPLFKDLKDKVGLLQSKIDLLNLQFEQQASTSGLLAQIQEGQVLGASDSATLIQSLGDVELNNATITDNLMVLGHTTVTSLGVTGNINAGLLSIHGIDGEINTLAGDLKLQSNGLNGIDILNGKIVMDTKGNLTVAGTITAKQIEAENYTVLGQESIGSGTIPAGATSVEVTTQIASASSKIFLTSTSLTDRQITVIEKKYGKFKVAIPSPTTSPISFDWWIISHDEHR